MVEPKSEPRGRSAPTVFISYRWQDEAGFTRLIHRYLCDHLGSRHVFIDVENIRPGADLVETIRTYLDRSEVVLVVIGSRWAAVMPDGSRRLDDPEDRVRLEVETALQARKRIIPVLVESAVMPTAQQLPPGLAPLSRRLAVPLRNVSLTADLATLLRAIRSPVGHRELRPDLPLRGAAVVGIGLATLVVDRILSVQWPYALVSSAAVLLFGFGLQRLANSLLVTRGEPAPNVASCTQAAELRSTTYTTLSKTEFEVARRVASGLTNKQIADQLHNAERTIDNHVQHIYNKLGINSRVELTNWMYQKRLVDSETQSN